MPIHCSFFTHCLFPLKDLSFKNVQHLHNPWNENKPIKVGRDGQEIEPSKSGLK